MQPADAGCWTGALDALAFDARQPGETSVAAAWRMFQHPAGLDVEWHGAADPWPESSAPSSARRLYYAAQLLVEHTATAPAAWRSDPLWTAIAALAAAPSAFGFDGIPFIEAAAALDERGQAERAFNALTAVEFWNFHAAGEPMDGAVGAAHALALRQRWAHLATITGALLRSGDLSTV